MTPPVSHPLASVVRFGCFPSLRFPCCCLLPIPYFVVPSLMVLVDGPSSALLPCDRPPLPPHAPSQSRWCHRPSVFSFSPNFSLYYPLLCISTDCRWHICLVLFLCEDIDLRAIRQKLNRPVPKPFDLHSFWFCSRRRLSQRPSIVSLVPLSLPRPGKRTIDRSSRSPGFISHPPVVEILFSQSAPAPLRLLAYNNCLYRQRDHTFFLSTVSRSRSLSLSSFFSSPPSPQPFDHTHAHCLFVSLFARRWEGSDDDFACAVRSYVRISSTIFL